MGVTLYNGVTQPGGVTSIGTGSDVVPTNVYTAEDGTTDYVAEDGTTYYVQES